MKRLLSILFIIILCITGTVSVSADPSVSGKSSNVQWPSGPKVFAKTAVLIDASTGTVLYDKKKDKKKGSRKQK